MHTYICNLASKKIVLKEHISYKWMELKNLRNLDWAAADIPIVDKLILELNE